MTSRPLRVFLCHSSNDKPTVRELYQKLRAEPWIQPWLDEEELYPGQDWNMEIEKAVEAADAIIVCLSKGSITKEGYVQKEIRAALDYADYKPEGTLFIIPVRLEECTPPKRLGRWQYADYFEGQRERAFQRLLVSLKKRADSLDLKIEEPAHEREEKSVEKKKPAIDNAIPASKKETKAKEKKTIVEISKPMQVVTPPNKITLTNGMEFMRVPAGKFLMGSNDGENNEKPQHTVDLPYDYWMARFPVTNELYFAYTTAKGIKHLVDWWKQKKDHPVTYVNFGDAIDYCQWLSNLLKNELPSGLVLRMPTECEWEKAARGTDGRMYPWGNVFDINNCNVSSSSFLAFVTLTANRTTPVNKYSPQGDSSFGCADMAGNVQEWTQSLLKNYPYKSDDGREKIDIRLGDIVLRGGSFNYNTRSARCTYRNVSCVHAKVVRRRGVKESERI